MARLTVSSPALVGTSSSDVVLGQEDNAFPSIGIEVLNNGVINTKAGNDTIKGIGNGGNAFSPPIEGRGIGIANNGIIKAGQGDDTITGAGNGGSQFRATATGIGIFNTQGGYIDGGDGKDLISGTGKGGAAGSPINTGINNSEHSRIDGGKGDDSIVGSGTGTIFASAIGISNTQGSEINGGEGNDSITGIAKGSDAVLAPFSSFVGQGIGISNGEGSIIRGGKGNDSISGTGTGGAGLDNNPPVKDIEPGEGIGIVNKGLISLGDGEDTLIGTGISLGVGIDNTNGTIDGGAGGDILTGYGTRIGIQGGTIDGGKGDDYFKARRIDDNGNPVSDQKGAIADVLIKGGYGCDTFDVGYGNATIDGGQGWDKLILPDFKCDYAIAGSCNNYTIKRDGFTLNVFDVEEIAFLGVSTQNTVV